MFLNLPIIFTLLSSLISSYFGVNYTHLTKRYSIHGIDISHHQKYIDWDHVVDHSHFKVNFCFMKATEGATFSDSKFDSYWKACREVGISRGAYHFFSIGSNPVSQAQHFIRTVKLEDGDLAPVLDFEKSSQSISTVQIRRNLYRWLTIVEKHYGIKPIIYTNNFIYNKYLKGYFKDYPLWIADYDTSNFYESNTHPNLKLWQYTEKGWVNGISGHVDINAFLGEPDEFKKLKLSYKENPEEAYNIIEDITPSR